MAQEMQDRTSLITVKKKPSGYSATIPAKKMLDLYFGNNLPNPKQEFKEILNDLDTGARALVDEYNAEELKKKESERKECVLGQGSLNRCHGEWSEYICDVTAWNVLCELNASKDEDEECFVYVKLPNSNVSKKKNVWTSLLSADPQQLIEERRKRLTRTENALEVKLESSNPDAAILRLSPSRLPGELDPRRKMTNISEENQKTLSSVFGKCKGHIESEGQLVAFLSYKTSTRADRRYQWIVEGNSVKGLIAAAFDNDQNPYKLGVLMQNRYYAFDLDGTSQGSNHEVLDGLIMFSSLFNESAIGRVSAIDGLYEPITPAAYGDRIREICSK